MIVVFKAKSNDRDSVHDELSLKSEFCEHATYTLNSEQGNININVNKYRYRMKIEIKLWPYVLTDFFCRYLLRI